MADRFQRYLEEIQEQRRRDKERLADPPPEPPPLPHNPQHFALRRGTPPPGAILGPGELAASSVEEVRLQIRRRIMRYTLDDAAVGKMLVIRVPAGVGKTHIAVDALQDMPNGNRILYTVSRHNFWSTLGEFPHFDEKKWYHWLPIRGADDNGNGETCRYSEEMYAWLGKGYPSFQLCSQVCLPDGHLNRCPYRAQRSRQERIIFAMHHHLSYGMSIQDYSLAVVDEIPLSAFMDKRIVKAADIIPAGSGGDMHTLFTWLHELVTGENRGHSRGKELLDLIGPTLEKIYESIDLEQSVMPAIPELHDVREVDQAPAFYWNELLKKLSPEFECWKLGRRDWLSRVRTYNKLGLVMYGRKSVWEHLPQKLIALDATGTAEMYNALFQRPVEIYAPQVERKGRVFQVTGRLYGISSVLEDVPGEGPRGGKRPRLTKQGRELMGLSQLIARRYKRPGVVTFKNAVPYFQRHFENVMHFGALRGSNELQEVDGLIVAGGYSPPLSSVMDYAASLFPNRMEPFLRYEIDDEGREQIRYPWVPAPVEYRTKDRVYWRYHSGFWKDYELRTVLEQVRQAEIVQAIHRGRPNTRVCDVWLLTSIPTFMILDGVYGDPAEAKLTPERDKVANKGVPWSHWTRLKPWLDEMWKAASEREDTWLTPADLAEVTGVKPATVRGQEWLLAIARFEPDHWYLEPRQLGRGRPRLGLLAVEL